MRMVHFGLCAAMVCVCFSAAAHAQTAPSVRPPQNYPPQNYQAPQQDPRYAPQRPATTQPAQTYGPQPPAGYGQSAQGAPQQSTPRMASQPGSPAQGAATKPIAPAPPFVLTPAQQASLDQILTNWERHSENVKVFKCQFNRWDYNVTFGPTSNNQLFAEGKGVVKFKAPDHGVYRVTEMKEWEGNPTSGKYVDKKEGLDHWVCDGQSIYQFETATKRLIETKLPPTMRGKAIADGPLPFIFGANAATLKRRYLMREITPSDVASKQIWLEAYPRFQSDAANFRRVEFILTRDDYLPFALQIYLPNTKDRTVYQFNDISINSFNFLNFDFAAPSTPFGWKKVVNDPNAAPPAAPQAPPAQAQRPTAPTK